MFEGQLAGMAIGNTHSLTLTNNGKVYSIGSGDMGQLGLGTLSSLFLSFSPSLPLPFYPSFSLFLPSLFLSFFLAFSLSLHYNLFLIVFVDTITLCEIPQQIKCLVDIKLIACGDFHCLALSGIIYNNNNSFFY